MSKAKTCRGDPLMWAARRLYEALAQHDHDSGGHFASAVQMLLHQQDQVAQHWRRAGKAAAKGWHAAAMAERQQLVDLLRSRHYYVSQVINNEHGARMPNQAAAMTARAILQDLRQLQEEFDQLVIEPKRGSIAVVTKPVILSDVRLGRFRLELYVDRLRDRQDVTVVDCVALDPNPASTSDDTTHPHVQNNVLCAGDATMPLQAALRQGRVCDAFLLINAVLHTYNGASPYVSLDDWFGMACADCGYTTDEESMYRCENCEQHICDNCVGTCDGCDASYCQSCLERAQAEHLCPACRTTCPRCDEIVRASDVQELGMCRSCHEDEEEQQELELQEQDNHEHDDDDAVVHEDDNDHANNDAAAFGGDEGKEIGRAEPDAVAQVPVA